MKPEVWVTAGSNEVLSTPQILPGNRLMFSVRPADADWDAADVVVLNADGERKVVLRGGTGARYVSSGHIAYVRGSDLFAIPFDLDEMRTTGDAVPVAQGIMRSAFSTGAPNFDISDTGTLMFAVGAAVEGGNSRRILAIADRNGNSQPVPGLEAGAYSLPRVSPDGSRVALAPIDDASISSYDLSGKSRLRPLTLEGTNTAPVWSPDSMWLAFRSVRDGKIGLFVQKADGSSPAERLTTTDAGQDYPVDWSLDDRIVFVREGRLWTLARKDRRVELMPDQPVGPGSRGAFSSLSLSPKSMWAAFAAGGGRPAGSRVFMRQFPDGATYPVSRELAEAPVWSPDGRELFYFQPANGTLVAVRIQAPPAFSVSEPFVVPLKSFYQPAGGPRQFDIMPDGRLLILQPAPEESQASPRTTQQIVVVMNWGDELRKTAPRRE